MLPPHDSSENIIVIRDAGAAIGQGGSEGVKGNGNL